MHLTYFMHYKKQVIFVSRKPLKMRKQALMHTGHHILISIVIFYGINIIKFQVIIICKNPMNLDF